MLLFHFWPKFSRYQFNFILQQSCFDFYWLVSQWFRFIIVCCIAQLAVSSLLLWKECQNSPLPKMTTEWKTVSLYPIPSIIYLIHNNVQFATLTFVDTSTYQIMGNLKIVTTGILFRCVHCLVMNISHFLCSTSTSD